MLVNKRVSLFKFFYNHCVKNYTNTLFLVSFAACYWAVDIQFRNWIFKEVLEKFETVPRESAVVSMLPWIYMFFLSMIIRFFIFRFSSYIRIYYMPKMKINVMNFLMKEVLLKSNVLLKKELDVISNQIQEILKNLELMVEVVFIEFAAHFILLISPYYMFMGNYFLLYGISMLYTAFFFVSYIGYHKGVKLNASVISFDMILFSRFNDVFSNLFNVKLLNTTKHEETKLKTYLDQFTNISIKKDFWSLIINGLLSCIFVAYHCFCIVYLIWQYQIGEISKAYFPYVISNNKEITESLWEVVEKCIELSEAVGKTKESLERVFRDTENIEEKAKNFKLTSHSISIENIHFTYPGSKTALFENLSINIKDGDKIGIVGYSGSGKSSLASLLLNLIPVQSGFIKIGGYDINLFSHEYLYSLITYMNQDLCLFNRTVKENITYSKLNATEEEIVEAAKMANIHDFIMQLPNGYDTLIEYQGKEFSYGQKQRMLIARAFLRDTPILILDEVTSSLDTKSEKMVMESLHKLMKNKTVIIIAHKIKTLLKMDYILTMNKGEIVESGTHEELTKKKGLYFELCNT
ncbi:ABC transporter ATP-binding protein [Alphaproteobacteria bacterium endosymbiont of Tiliacea citrago]|uniref:ABC transporter ATP-binding protein n=1 Tax=Alphaproteobacteria bacterium endosymbiont of Tiliacea citrago TaxID=3077944 RepID=UPI00313E6C86